jgi:serine phosphatase RsbU (regulator of sigma subunit)
MSRDVDLRVRGLRLMPRFALAMTAALTLVMAVAGFALYETATRIAANSAEARVEAGLRLTHADPPMRQADASAEQRGGGVRVFRVAYGNRPEKTGVLYLVGDPQDKANQPTRLLVPEETDRAGRTLQRTILALMIVVVLVGAGVALIVAGQVSRPIGDLVQDVRTIAAGNLSHRIRARGSGEVELLSRSIDRMARAIEEGREAELELSIRDRELELASSVREALLPTATPLVPGYDLGAAHLASASIGGDLHDWIEYEDGRVGLLVCDVSGQGVPAALVGATARSFLRSELQGEHDLVEAFSAANRELARDVRQGMYVTALFALVDPGRHVVRVACAGHRVPLLRWAASDGKLRAVQPDGIALGFDRGPVFDERLEVAEFPMEPGDRLLLANTGPLVVTGGEGKELGEEAFYTLVARAAPEDTVRFLRALRTGLEEHGDGVLPRDVSLLTITREGLEA